MTDLLARSDRSTGRSGRTSVRIVARPGIAVAASAPAALVVLSVLPAHRPHDLIIGLLSLVAAGVLVMVAEVASYERAGQPGEVVPSAARLGPANRIGPGSAAPSGPAYASSRAPALALAPALVLAPAPASAPAPALAPAPASAPARAGPNQWSDPAMVSVGRWLAHWPGVAGVSAASWWAARVGAAGLLCTFGFSALGLSRAAWVAAAVVAALAVLSLAPASRHVVHGALGLVATAGAVVTGSGIIALLQGRLSTPVLPSGPFLPSASSAVTTLQEAAITIVLLCLAAICLTVVNPATSGVATSGVATSGVATSGRGTSGGGTSGTGTSGTGTSGAGTSGGGTSGGGSRAVRALIWGGVGTSVFCWAFAVPVLLRVGGFSLPSGTTTGSARAVSSALSVVLGPLGGSHASTLARGVLCVTCVAAALGALAGATRLAETAIGAARSMRAAQRGAALNSSGAALNSSGVALDPAVAALKAARTTRRPGHAHVRAVPSGVLVAIAFASGAGAAGVALAGSRGWLVVALGGMAAGALALTTLAPPVLRQCQSVPAAVRACVVAIWAVVATVAIGSAGPAALALVATVCLGGAFALGWRGPHVEPGPANWHRAIPWGSAATAFLAVSAVTALEALPTGAGHSGAGVWRGLAVLVAACGILVLAVFPATARLRTEHLANSASTLATKALPALAEALEALAAGNVSDLPIAGLSELKAATRPLEAEPGAYGASEEMVALARALVGASGQVQRLAEAVRDAGYLDRRRLEELVEERTVALSSVNRHLVDSQWRRRQLLDRTVRAAEEERSRIAANLHDGPIQGLATVGLILDRCSLRLDRDDKAGAHELVKRARNELSGEIQSLRQMMSELRPPILDEGGLEAAIQDHVSAWSAATGIPACFDVEARSELSADSETVIYRVVQEALANVAKHARASFTAVTLGQSGNGVQVVVRDNGRGFATPSQPDLLRNGHFGLVVMRERVELAAGRFEVQSAPRVGTKIIIWVPTTLAREPVEAI